MGGASTVVCKGIAQVKWALAVVACRVLRNALSSWWSGVHSVGARERF